MWCNATSGCTPSTACEIVTMALDPTARFILAALQKQGVKSFEQLSVAEARAVVDTFPQLQNTPQDVRSVEDLDLNSVPLRVYTPDNANGSAILYTHGGGWVGGHLGVCDEPARAMANETGAVVVATSYRLAPEARFPAQTDDVYAALEWLRANAERLGVDPQRIAVVGDSAGGNLAAVLALDSRDGGLALAFQLLIYPAIDLGSLDTESYRQCASGFGLTRADVAWFLEQYFGADDASRHDWRASPLRAPDLRDLPPALVMTAEFDVLRSEGEDYAVALEAAGNAVTLRRYDGATHGFMSMAGLFELGRQGRRDAAAALKAALG